MSNQPYKVPPLPLNCGNIFAHCQFRKSVKSKLFLPLSLSLNFQHLHRLRRNFKANDALLSKFSHQTQQRSFVANGQQID